MFKSLKDTLKKIEKDPPGERFYRQFERRQKKRGSILSRILFMLIGVVALLLGLIMIFTPGPGILGIFIGLGFISQESRWLAKSLDRLEVYMRRWFNWAKRTWKNTSIVGKFILFIIAVLIVAGIIYIGYFYLMR